MKRWIKYITYVSVLILVLSTFTLPVNASTELEGSWIGISPDDPSYEWICEVTGNYVYFIDPVGKFWGTINIDKTKNPNQIDITIIGNSADEYYNGKTSHGIYEIDGDTVRLSAYEIGNPMRPTSFSEGKYLVLTRIRSNDYPINVDTGFQPGIHGFAFKNFVEWPYPAHCLGMSATSLAYFVYNIPLPSPGTLCNPIGEDIPHTSCITYLAIKNLQDSLSILSGLKALEDLLLSIVIGDKDIFVTAQLFLLSSYLENGPSIIILPKACAGHAVVAYKIEINENNAKVWIYDSNYPSDDKKILVL
jgi:uncharacterized protein (TIGR03067 family)